MADDVRGGECVNLSGEGMCQECINGSHNSPVRFVARGVAYHSKEKELCGCPCHLPPPVKRRAKPAADVQAKIDVPAIFINGRE